MGCQAVLWAGGASMRHRCCDCRIMHQRMLGGVSGSMVLAPLKMSATRSGLLTAASDLPWVGCRAEVTLRGRQCKG